MMTIVSAALMAAVASLASGESRVPASAVPGHSAEAAWLGKKVHDRRVLEDMTSPGRWKVNGRGELKFPRSPERPNLRVEVELRGLKGLPIATAVRPVAGEDWRAYNRISFWLRTDVVGFPVLTLIVSLRNQGTTPVAAVHLREVDHHVTVPNGKWTQVVWEVPHVARDRVTSLEFRPWVNKRLPAATDRVAYEIGAIELQRVEPDHYEGWNVAPGKISFSHTGYLPGSPKTALASGLTAKEFELLRAGKGTAVLRKAVERRSGRTGEFQVFDFSEVREPGSYVLRAGSVQSRPFRIGSDVWDTTIAKTVNFFYAERCGMRVPGTHEACHIDWQASQGDRKVVMNGGWHDAGDLSQGLINTGEATHVMFSLAAEMRRTGRRPLWLPQLLEEAKWGLEWIHKVRFPGGHRVGFASMNLWTDGIIGNEDDRTAAALNNPNVNYIAAMAGAAAARYLKDIDAGLAARSLSIAEEDWRHAITGIESPATLSTPAFAASEMELAAVGVIASVELFQATGREEYARKARELGRIVVASQQATYVGSSFPLAGFLYTGPDRRQILHQFHRGNDQAAVMAVAMLCDAFPDDAEWMSWYAVAVRYAEYQKRAATSTAPYDVLPAYVYRDNEWEQIAEGDRYGSSRQAFRQQVLAGMPMGGGYYLKAFPVWFTRRGNYGVLLSQVKGLSAAARLRGDREAADLVQSQLQWVVGRNPFCQSTMWGEGYDFAPQYSVSVGDIVGSLPVGMMTRDNDDRPYWPASNTYVFKEVWVHPSVRWLSILEDVEARPAPEPFRFTLRHEEKSGGQVKLTLEATGQGRHSFSVRSENLEIDGGRRELALQAGGPSRMTWTARVQDGNAPWVAVVIADGNVKLRRDVAGVK